VLVGTVDNGHSEPTASTPPVADTRSLSAGTRCGAREARSIRWTAVSQRKPVRAKTPSRMSSVSHNLAGFTRSLILFVWRV
jgi:hypothetical protein